MEQETPLGFPRGDAADAKRANEETQVKDLIGIQLRQEAESVTDEIGNTVHRAPVCPACPALMMKVEKIETNQDWVMDTLKENKETLREIRDALREGDRAMSDTDKELALIEERVKSAAKKDAVDASTKRAIWITVASHVAMQAGKKIFGF